VGGCSWVSDWGGGSSVATAASHVRPDSVSAAPPSAQLTDKGEVQGVEEQHLGERARHVWQSVHTFRHTPPSVCADLQTTLEQLPIHAPCCALTTYWPLKFFRDTSWNWSCGASGEEDGGSLCRLLGSRVDALAARQPAVLSYDCAPSQRVRSTHTPGTPPPVGCCAQASLIPRTSHAAAHTAHGTRSVSGGGVTTDCRLTTAPLCVEVGCWRPVVLMHRRAAQRHRCTQRTTDATAALTAPSKSGAGFPTNTGRAEQRDRAASRTDAASSAAALIAALNRLAACCC
jgi:hypothetical protein